jgi:hypothetical protein
MYIDFPFEPHTYSLWMHELFHLSVRGYRDLKNGEWPKYRGIYFLCNSIGVTYIGKSENLFKRLENHADHAPNNAPFSHALLIPLLGSSNISEWEAEAIKMMGPQFNNQCRDYRVKYCDSVLNIHTYLATKRYFELKVPFPIYRVRFDRGLLDNFPSWVSRDSDLSALSHQGWR